jgi:excisionase family DNA binding protein
MSDQEELLDIKQAAQFLNVSETSLRRWTDSGRLACLRVGRRRERRFRRRDLLAFMEQQPATVDAAPEVAVAPASAGGHTVIGGIQVPYGRHFGGFYGTDAGRLKVAVGFLADGLRPGSVCYLVAAPDVRDEILDQLAQDRRSLEKDIGAGRLVLADHARSARAQYQYFETQFVGATRAGAHSLRVVGDMGSFARKLTPSALVDFEAGYERLIARRFPVVTLCQYDTRRFSSTAILHALKGHPDTFGYPAERLLG